MGSDDGGPRWREEDPWVIRTDFSDDGRWEDVRALIAAPQRDGEEEFFAYVRFVDELALRDKLPRDLVLSSPDDYPASFCFVVDRECLEAPEHPVLVVGFSSSSGYLVRPPRETPAEDVKSFRALPSTVQSIENNLSVGNMGFDEFADCADESGVFRG